MIKETVIKTREITIEQVKEMLASGASIKADLFKTGYISDDNEPIEEYRLVVESNTCNEKTTVILNMIDALKLIELYRR